MYFFSISRVDGMRFRLITISCVGALVIDLDHHTRANREPVRGVPVTLGRDVPALTATFADSRDYAGGAAVDRVVAEVRTAGIGEVVGGGETGGVIAGCRWTTGDSGSAGWVPGEGGGKDRVGVGLGICGLEGGGEEEEGLVK